MISTEKLATQIKEYSNAYYNGKPIVTDAEFDILRDKLEAIDPNHPALADVGSPVQSGWPTHKHRELMGSLHKSTTREAFFEWAKGKGEAFVLSEKYDGSTVVASYEKGKLVTLATRGDGSKGEDITPNAAKITRVPDKLAVDFTGDLRGEAILRKSLFKKHFPGSSNPRNCANGKVRDTKDDPRKQHIEVKWFDVLPLDRDFKTEVAKWEFLLSLSLVGDYDYKILTPEEIWTDFLHYRDPHPQTAISTRMHLDYEIDGLVVKVNDIDLQESFGVRSGRPKGAIALKFPSAEKTTIVKDIIWQRGLTGSFCPVAILESVEIGGVNIARASLCGIEEIQRLDVAIGDEVIVSRRNDVIPKIERVLNRGKRPKTTAPTHCFECKEELFRDGAYLLCTNTECQGEIYGNLMTWIKTLKIKGFGPAFIRGLIEEDIRTIAHLYTSNISKFNLAANSESNGKKRFQALHAAKELRLGIFLTGLNVKALGNTNGRRLEKQFGDLDAVLEATDEDFQEVPGIKTNAKKIVKGLKDKARLIKELRGLLTIKCLKDSGVLAGVGVCITGDLTQPRASIQDWVRSNGGEIKSGVSKNLTYLMTNDPDSGSGKNKKADKLGIKKITEQDLYDLVGSKPE